MSKTQTISQSNVDWLRSIGEPVVIENGEIKIRRSALRSSSDPSSDDEESVLPQIIESVDALQFSGLKKKKAAEILEIYNSMYEDYIADGATGLQPSLTEVIRNNIEHSPFNVCDSPFSGSASDQEWETALHGLGIRRSMREGILDPHPNFVAIRGMDSAKGWALKMVLGSFDYLTSCDGTVRDKRRWATMPIPEGDWPNGAPRPPPRLNASILLTESTDLEAPSEETPLSQ